MVMNNLLELGKVFKVIYQLKYLKPQLLEITKQDEKLFFKSYFQNKIWRKTTYRKWKNCVINYSIENVVPFNESILYFSNWLKNNKKLNG